MFVILLVEIYVMEVIFYLFNNYFEYERYIVIDRLLVVVLKEIMLLYEKLID